MILAKGEIPNTLWYEQNIILLLGAKEEYLGDFCPSSYSVFQLSQTDFSGLPGEIQQDRGGGTVMFALPTALWIPVQVFSQNFLK